MKNNGLKEDELKVSDPALLDIVRYYTREAGVRNLEREVAKICRKAVKQMLLHKKDQKSVTVSPRNLDKFLGVKRFRYGKAEDLNRVG
ncbi:endopeptidase La, partial [Acinetobacter baumannii]